MSQTAKELQQDPKIYNITDKLYCWHRKVSSLPFTALKRCLNLLSKIPAIPVHVSSQS